MVIRLRDRNIARWRVVGRLDVPSTGTSDRKSGTSSISDSDLSMMMLSPKSPKLTPLSSTGSSTPGSIGLVSGSFTPGVALPTGSMQHPGTQTPTGALLDSGDQQGKFGSMKSRKVYENEYDVVGVMGS